MQNQIRDDFVHFSNRNQLGLSLPSGAFQPNKIVLPNPNPFLFTFFSLFSSFMPPKNFLAVVKGQSMVQCSILI